MKRPNPETGLPFKRGYVREDGRVFKSYMSGRVRKDGFFVEHWTTPEKLDAHKIKNRDVTRRWVEQNPEKKKMLDKEWRKNNKERKRLNNRAWDLANPEKAKASKQKYAEANREKKNARQRERVKMHPEITMAYVRKRQAAKVQRTPPWFNPEHLWMTKEAYALAKLRERVIGGKWHVDHIVPLRGKTVSGLHVPWNLQVIPDKLNRIKGNRWQDGNC